MSAKVTVITDLHHSQESTVPTLHSPTSAILNSQSKDVFQRLTVSRPATEVHTSLVQARPRSRGWPSEDFQAEMMKKLKRSQAKIKALRDQVERERMSEVRPRPRISGRSRELAAKVNDRFFAKYSAQSEEVHTVEPAGQKDKENANAQNAKLSDAIDFLDPEEVAVPSNFKASLHDRIRSYLRSPSQSQASVYSVMPTKQAPPSTLQGPRHRRLGATLSPVVRRVSYDSGCDWTRYPSQPC